FFPRAEQERLKREYHSIRQTDIETSTEFMQRFLRLVGFLGAAAGTAEEQAKNFQWGLRKSTLNHLMCIPFTDVAQVANTARNSEILHERDDDGAERGGGDNHRSNNNYSGNNNRKKKGGSASSTTPPTPIATLTPITTVVAAPWLSAAAKGKQPARATSPTDP
nr:zinc finger, CCHC-type, retrotransposon Gag domain protein [Tanacetum cinerariifolium]